MTALDDTGADVEAGELLADTAAVLAGLLAAGLLAEVGTPERLPDVLPAALPVEEVRRLVQVWARVGFAAGYRKGQRRWDPEGLLEAERTWRDAGDTVLADLVHAAAAVAPQRPVGAG